MFKKMSKLIIILIFMLLLFSCAKKEVTKTVEETKVTTEEKETKFVKKETLETTKAETQAPTTTEVPTTTEAPTTAVPTTKAVEIPTTAKKEVATEKPTTAQASTSTASTTQTLPPATSSQVDTQLGMPSSTSEYYVNNYSVTTVTTTNYAGKLAVNVSQKADQAATAVVAAIIKPGMSDYQKVRAIHDYLVNNVNYDYANLLTNTLPAYVFTAEGALVKKSAVCQGYAEAFCLLAHKSGIYAEMVYGTANTIAHAWNIVKIGGDYYHVDATYDDPIINGQVVPDGSNRSYDYFLLSDTELSGMGTHVITHYSNPYSCPKSSFYEVRRAISVEKYKNINYVIVNNIQEGISSVTAFVDNNINKFNIIIDVTSADKNAVSDYYYNNIEKAIQDGALNKGYSSFSVSFTTIDIEGSKYLVFSTEVSFK